MQRFKLDPKKKPAKSRTDWSEVDAISDDQALKNALEDPDALPVSESVLRRSSSVREQKLQLAQLTEAAEAIYGHIGCIRKYMETVENLGRRFDHLFKQSHNMDKLQSLLEAFNQFQTDADSVRKSIGNHRYFSERYLVCSFDDRWGIWKSGDSKPTSVHRTKADAEKTARRIARDAHGELTVFYAHGGVQKRSSYAA